jgi:hypothetical protein
LSIVKAWLKKGIKNKEENVCVRERETETETERGIFKFLGVILNLLTFSYEVCYNRKKL